MTGLLVALRGWLYGNAAKVTSRRDAVELIGKASSGELRRLTDQSLYDVIQVLLSVSGYRTALRGNVRFLESVSKSYTKRRRFTLKQRYALYNILERAYPHNLAAELRNLES